MVSHGMKIYICPAKQPDMDVYADGWKALKRTTNQKAVGSNPAGRAISKYDETSLRGLISFWAKSKSGTLLGKIGQIGFVFILGFVQPLMENHGGVTYTFGVRPDVVLLGYG